MAEFMFPNVTYRASVYRTGAKSLEKVLKFEAEGREFAKFLRSLELHIYSNSERSEKLLVTECFFNLFLEVSHIWKKILGFRNMQEKLEKLYFVF